MNDWEKFWEELGDVPVDEDGRLEEPFYGFPVGTDREEVWHWIEGTFGISVGRLMNGVEQELYYKVVSVLANIDGTKERTSVFNPKYRITYAPMEWTSEGRPFIFRDFADVEKFIDRDLSWQNTENYLEKADIEVWRCEVKNPEPIKVVALHQQDIPDFWRVYPDFPAPEFSTVPTILAPQGSYVADAIRLVQRIK